MSADREIVVFIATGNQSTVELITEVLADDFDQLVVSTSAEALVGEFDRSGADVLLLAYNELAESEAHYDTLCLRSGNIHSKPLKVLVLCNKFEARRAYELCRSRRFDNYVVFWSLSYDPFRLPMSLHQAAREINEIYRFRDNLAVSSARGQAFAELEELFNRQVEGGQVFSAKVSDSVDKAEQNIRRMYHEFGHQGWESALLSNRERDDGEGDPIYNLEQIRESFQRIRGLARELDVFSNDNIRSSNLMAENASRHRPGILVVEDDAFQRNLLGSLLRAGDYDVDFANSGEEAIDKLYRSAPDLILMDIVMPGMGGIEATRYIRANPWSKNIPIIIISGQNQRDIVLECIKLGANGFVLKPFNRQVIMKKVSETLIPFS